MGPLRYERAMQSNAAVTAAAATAAGTRGQQNRPVLLLLLHCCTYGLRSTKKAPTTHFPPWKPSQTRNLELNATP